MTILLSYPIYIICIFFIKMYNTSVYAIYDFKNFYYLSKI
jgi:hypothetical protein